MKTEIQTEIQEDGFVYLHDVPFFDQSSQDMHCGYYCAIMLLVGIHGENAWRAWWENKLESEEVNKQLDEKGLKMTTLKKYIEENNVYPTKTRLIQVKGARKKYRLADEKNLLEPEKFCEEIEDALFGGKPSILRLPYSFHHPYGHFVVIKGYAEVIERKEDEPRKLFIANDPLVGETSLWIPRRTRCNPLKANADDPYGATALISEQETHCSKMESLLEQAQNNDE